MKTWIRAKRLISDGFVMENTGVLAEDGVILSILPTPPANAQVLDLQEATLAPALIDLHCHGGAGFEFIDATEEAILGACKIHSDHGTGVLYPTVSAADFDTTWRALEALEKTVSK
ncbi:MAG: hypothetical protein IKD18_06595, partial [Clostridia bacterium]|nr:hypothetical protein [Clostridia bacterium]